MNNKGYTLLEMIVVLALSAILTYSAFYVPTDLYKTHFEYTNFADSTSDNYHLRKTISQDISEGTLKKLSESKIQIGKHVYEFNEVVKRDSIAITRKPYSFNMNESQIEIFNDTKRMTYSVNSSFLRGEQP